MSVFYLKKTQLNFRPKLKSNFLHQNNHKSKYLCKNELRSQILKPLKKLAVLYYQV